MVRRLISFAAIVAICAAGIACSDNSPKIIPPKTENTKLPSEASAGGGGGAPKANQPAVNPNPPSGGTAKQE